MAKVGTNMFDISGKLGDLVYYSYRGKKMVRRASTRKRINTTQQQLEHQAKFALIGNFLRSIQDFLKATYKIYNRNKTGYQKAFSENYREALSGTYPSFSIDYSKARLGNGKLPNATDPMVSSPDPGKLVFTWEENDNWNRALSSDQFYVAIYSEKLNQWNINFKIVERYKKFCRVDASYFSGTRVHVFIGFESADRKQVSTPLYTGAINVS